MTLCHLCKEKAVTAFMIKIGTFHEARDQRDSTRMNIIPLCQEHYDEVLRMLKVHP
jgi:hypothetical protein